MGSLRDRRTAAPARRAIAASARHSAADCRIRRHRPAPTARRMRNSRRRASARANIRVAKLVHIVRGDARVKHLGEMVRFFERAPTVRFPFPFQRVQNRKLLAEWERKLVSLNARVGTGSRTGCTSSRDFAVPLDPKSRRRLRHLAAGMRSLAGSATSKTRFGSGSSAKCTYVRDHLLAV
jgi:hypothetical protein